MLKYFLFTLQVWGLSKHEHLYEGITFNTNNGRNCVTSSSLDSKYWAGIIWPRKKLGDCCTYFYNFALKRTDNDPSEYIKADKTSSYKSQLKVCTVCCQNIFKLFERCSAISKLRVLINISQCIMIPGSTSYQKFLERCYDCYTTSADPD